MSFSTSTIKRVLSQAHTRQKWRHYHHSSAHQTEAKLTFRTTFVLHLNLPYFQLQLSEHNAQVKMAGWHSDEFLSGLIYTTPPTVFFYLQSGIYRSHIILHYYYFINRC